MLLSNINKEEAFKTSRFSIWKNETESERGFTQHESPKTHGDAVLQFLKIPSETNDLIQIWKSKKYTSPVIQNEIIKDMALIILHDIVNSIKDSGCYSIMADESSDISNEQQFIICIWWVDKMRTLVDFML